MVAPDWAVLAISEFYRGRSFDSSMTYDIHFVPGARNEYHRS